jgi:hypothetical protein
MFTGAEDGSGDSNTFLNNTTAFIKLALSSPDKSPQRLRTRRVGQSAAYKIVDFVNVGGMIVIIIKDRQAKNR